MYDAVFRHCYCDWLRFSATPCFTYRTQHGDTAVSSTHLIYRYIEQDHKDCVKTGGLSFSVSWGMNSASVSNEIAAGAGGPREELSKGHLVLCVCDVNRKSAHKHKLLNGCLYLCVCVCSAHVLICCVSTQSVVRVCWHWDLISDTHRPRPAQSDQRALLIVPLPLLPPHLISLFLLSVRVRFTFYRMWLDRLALRRRVKYTASRWENEEGCCVNSPRVASHTSTLETKCFKTQIAYQPPYNTHTHLLRLC